MLAISAVSTQYIYVPVTATLPNGNTINPTSDTVQFAFLGPFNSVSQAIEQTPTSATNWQTASWASGTPYTAQCLVGPNGGVVALAIGTYAIYLKITDNPEIPVLYSGPVSVN